MALAVRVATVFTELALKELVEILQAIVDYRMGEGGVVVIAAPYPHTPEGLVLQAL